MSEVLEQNRPASVPLGAKQDGEAQAQWDWVEASVWTSRMLTALKSGVKGGRWFSLMDKVYAPANLAAAWKRVRSNRGAAGVDGQSVARFERDAATYLEELHRDLKQGIYRPSPVRRRWIEKLGTNKKRPLGIPTVRDRIVQSALRHVLEPIWEAKFAEQSYGFRPKRSCKDALRRVQRLLRNGNTWVVDADIQSYYDSIDHDRMLAEVEKEVADGKVLSLVSALMKQSVTEESSTWVPEEGIPQGSTIGPLFANVYLHPVDEVLKREGYEVTRFADDMVIQCKTKTAAQKALRLLRKELSRRGLKLHPEKTRVVNVFEKGGFEFLGYQFQRKAKRPREKSINKFKERVRELTRRNDGNSLATIITRVSAVLRGWFEYFKHCPLRVFLALDGWVRTRLRSVLNRRQKKKGIARGWFRRRWPNDYFAKLGLFTMTTARVQACQSLQGAH